MKFGLITTLIGTMLIASPSFALSKKAVIECSNSDFSRMQFGVRKASDAMYLSLRLPSTAIKAFNRSEDNSDLLAIVKKAKDCLGLEAALQKRVDDRIRETEENPDSAELANQIMMPYFLSPDKVEAKYGSAARKFLIKNGFTKAAKTLKGRHQEIVVQYLISDLRIGFDDEGLSQNFEAVLSDIYSEAETDEEYKEGDKIRAAMTADTLEGILFKFMLRDRLAKIQEDINP